MGDQGTAQVCLAQSQAEEGPHTTRSGKGLEQSVIPFTQKGVSDRFVAFHIITRLLFIAWELSLSSKTEAA